jgi:hypothetical protein
MVNSIQVAAQKRNGTNSALRNNSQDNDCVVVDSVVSICKSQREVTDRFEALAALFSICN